MWTLDVNDVFNSNEEALHAIYNQLIMPGQKVLTKEAIFDLFCNNKDELTLPYKDVGIAFTCCKTTVADEVNEGSRKYDRISFVEFLDFLGRLS